MKRIILICLLLIGCTNSKSEEDTYKVGSCYKKENESIKLVGIIDNIYYYKHSWNDQDEIFNSRYISGIEIPCGKLGYEFEILLYKIYRLERDVKYLDDLTIPLRKKRK